MSSPLLPNPFENDRLADAEGYNPALDVATVHRQATDWLEHAVHHAAQQSTPDGKAKIGILTSTAGFGKTHILGRIGHHRKDAFLFFIPQFGEQGSPVKHVIWHLLARLFDVRGGQRPALHLLLAQLCQTSFQRYFDFLPHTLKDQHKVLRKSLEVHADTVLEIIAEVKATGPFLALADSIAARLPRASATVVRALVLGWSSCGEEAWRWLRGDQLNEAQLASLRLPFEPPSALEFLRTLAFIFKQLALVPFICCDQSEGLLHRPAALKELTTSLMGWVDGIPNLVLSLTFLEDEWKKLSQDLYGAFLDRSHTLRLDRLNGTQAVELVRRRLASWPGTRQGKGPLWPFVEKDIINFAEKHQPTPRALLKQCALSLNTFLAKRSDQAIDIRPVEEKRPLEELFQQEWARSLDAIQKEQLDPENIQEERLFRATRSALDYLREARLGVGGMELLQIQAGALPNPDKHLSLQLKLALVGSAEAIPVVVALTKLSGGKQMTSFINALEEAVADPVVGSILIRPSSSLSLGKNTIGRQKYDALKNKLKLRLFELTEHRPAFEIMECYLRLLDRAGQKDLQLGTQAITVEQCRLLAVKTQVLTGLDLFEKVCSGWAAAVPAAVQPPVLVQSTTFSAAPAAKVSASAPEKPAALPTAIPPADHGTPQADTSWADRLLKAVAAKLTEFGQKVEPLGVEIGPTFGRLQLKPLGKTSIGRVRNHANDLRAHIAGIATVPVIDDQPGYISVDVQRPDRATVALASCLEHPPAKLASRPAFPVGVDVSGQTHWLDLADPSTCHILAAGTTGSGKSEFLKAMIAGLAARLSPLELQFVFVDPKRVTFNFPPASPYLLHPVAHTTDEAMPLVQKCFEETERRYALLEKRGLEHVGQLTGKDALPRILLVFDEFADLMADQENRRELEGSLKRIGALARAAGVHLVLATQRPDRDVVTPLLKANLPTRICLRVEGERNSKIILDVEGAENLLGHGDLFWKHGGGMVRLQGPYVTKDELENWLKFEG